MAAAERQQIENGRTEHLSLVLAGVAVARSRIVIECRSLPLESTRRVIQRVRPGIRHSPDQPLVGAVLGTLPLSLLRMVSVVLLSAAATGFVSIGAAGHSGRQQRKIGEIPAVQRKLSYLCATYCGSDGRVRSVDQRRRGGDLNCGRCAGWKQSEDNCLCRSDC